MRVQVETALPCDAELAWQAGGAVVAVLLLASLV